MAEKICIAEDLKNYTSGNFRYNIENMKKKKEQAKYLAKNFNSILKTFSKQEKKEKRHESFEFISARINEIKRYLSGDGEVKTMETKAPEEVNLVVVEEQPASAVQPSPELFEEIRSEHQNMHN